MRACSLFAVVLICLCSVSFANEIQLVRFSEDPWPPYTYGEEGQSPTGGIAVDVVNEIFTRLGVPTDLQLFPWKRCLAQMESGERDALMLLGYSEEREEYLAYTESIMVVKDLLYYNIESSPIEWETYEDLKGYSFARTFGFQYGRGFEDAVTEYGIVMHEAPSDENSFKMLAHGRIDAFICNEVTARTVFNNNPDLEGRFAVAEKPLKEGPLYMGISRKSPVMALLPEINQTILDMKEDGTMQEILDRF